MLYRSRYYDRLALHDAHTVHSKAIKELSMFAENATMQCLLHSTLVHSSPLEFRSYQWSDKVLTFLKVS